MRSFKHLATLTAIVVTLWTASTAEGLQTSRSIQQSSSARLEHSSGSASLRFLEGLRNRGYHDLAVDYLDQKLNESDLDPAIKRELSFERNQSLIDLAAEAPDLDRRIQVLDEARRAVEAFLQSYPDDQRVPEVRLQLAQLLYQRGQTQALQAQEAVEDGPDRDLKLASARAAFGQARVAFNEAERALEQAFRSFDQQVLDQEDAQYQARERARNRLLDAKLRRAIVDYDEAQTYAEGSEDRDRLLDQAIEQFIGLYEGYRTWISGVAARMWQAKCLEEQGNLGAAIGIYKEILDQTDDQLLPIRRQTAFFKIIAHRKRGEHALAEQQARRWLQSASEVALPIQRLGVQLELARNIDALLEANDPATIRLRDSKVEDIVQLLGDVIQYASPYKADAVTLLLKYRPVETVDRRTLVGLSYDRAMELARDAIATQALENAILYLRTALARVNAPREVERTNAARYLLGVTFYQTERYLDAGVTFDFIARRYPEDQRALNAAELGMGALLLADRELRSHGGRGSLDRLIDLAEYIVGRWPNAAQGDLARTVLGDLAVREKRYLEAASYFEAVTDPGQLLDAKASAGNAHWRQSLVLKAADPSSSDAESEADRALELLNEVYEARVEARVPLTDPERAVTAGNLAEILISLDQLDRALEILEIHTKGLIDAGPSEATKALLASLLRLQLQAHINAGQTNDAVQDMRSLQGVASGQSLTQLFFGLGRLLEEEMKEQQAQGNQEGLERTRNSFKEFLNALVEAESGQVYESLQWAGEQMLAINAPEQAIPIFDRVLDQFADHPRISRTKRKRAEGLRDAQLFNEAWTAIDLLIQENERSLEYRFARCELLEAWAEAERGRWNTAITYWYDLAKLLSRSRPRPPEYYDCWYHVARCQFRKGDRDAARNTIQRIMALSETLGSPEIKEKYLELRRQIGGSR